MAQLAGDCSTATSKECVYARRHGTTTTSRHRRARDRRYVATTIVGLTGLWWCRRLPMSGL